MNEMLKRLIIYTLEERIEVCERNKVIDSKYYQGKIDALNDVIKLIKNVETK